MSNHPKIPLKEAEAIANEIIDWIKPVVSRAVIAGSIRRRVPEVSDIEIVCIPGVEETALDLFGEATDTRNLLDALVENELSHDGKIGRRLDKNDRAAVGSRYKRLWWNPDDPVAVALDLFAVLPPAQWGVIKAIRTGPAKFTQAFVTQRSKGGYLPDWMRVYDGALWANMLSGEPGAVLIHTPEEEDFFKLIELPWIEPEARR